QAGVNPAGIVTFRFPPTATVPATFSWSYPPLPAAVPPTSTDRFDPAAKPTFPVVSIPAVPTPPGATVPPLATLTAPVTPEFPASPRVAVPFTVKVLPAVTPLTSRVPADTVVGPVSVLVPF